MKAIDIISLARANVRKLQPYSSARDDFQGTAAVFLDANENPFDSTYNRYPDPHQRVLKDAIATSKGTHTDQLFLGNGSDEAIDLMIRVFCQPGTENILVPQPTYGMYAVSAGVNDVAVISTSLTPTFELRAADVLNAVTPHTKIIFLCSPNNPSGNLLDRAQLETILNSFPGIVVIDEAYIDFAETASWTSRLQDFQNLVVLQTLSKAWGLAGLRLGLCFADPEIIHLLNKIKPPYNISTFTQSEALRSFMQRESQKNQWVQEIKKERERLRKNLEAMPNVKHIYPSDANFLLVKVDAAKRTYDHLVSRGIIVRDRSKVVLCDDCLRITVGTYHENSQLLSEMNAL